jgi:YidC/Oxa1 family membrane protein insertase
MIDFLYNLIIFPLTQIIDFCFCFSGKIFKETWISLIFISLVISIFCLPFYHVAEKWQEAERDKQKKMKPKIDKIRAVFSGDERYMITSVYYRQNHYHPIYALRSSFSLLIQIPFFIAAYAFLSNLETIKGAHFFFIHDLSLSDGLLRLGGSYINILPIIMTFINLAAGMVYTRGFPLKDKLQLTAMALFFLVILYNSPAALVIYWTMNNFFSLVKNLYYKIRSINKNTILFTFFSLFCLLFVYYILVIHKGNSSQRSVLAGAACIAALLPWVSLL